MFDGYRKTRRPCIDYWSIAGNVIAVEAGDPARLSYTVSSSRETCSTQDRRFTYSRVLPSSIHAKSVGLSLDEDKGMDRCRHERQKTKIGKVGEGGKKKENIGKEKKRTISQVKKHGSSTQEVRIHSQDLPRARPCTLVQVDELGQSEPCRS